LSCLEEIEQHVLSWGTHATVVAPEEMRQRLGKTAEVLWQRYRGAETD
jgi:predicted DNA-binding transcriptional regulator YafY